jgi:two-component system KDP operon response regulator KdpE
MNPNEQAAGPVPAGDPARLRILLVEDQPVNRSLVHAILTRSEHVPICQAQVTDAEDLAGARNALTAADFDLVLLDVQLPDGNGLSLLHDLADRPGRHRPAVIALTGGAMPHQHAAAVEAGCDAILNKPFLARDLISLAMQFTAAG